jgi:hypothetical protein
MRLFVINTKSCSIAKRKLTGRRIVMRKSIFFAALLSCTLQNAFASGVFQTVSGDVRAGPTSESLRQIAPNTRITEGTTVTTGPNGRAIMRLDDGHVVVLAGNSEFKLQAYKFDRASPATSNIAVQLLKGALRSFSGLIGGKNPGQFALSTATATIGIRGTDFSVALVNPAYISVVDGLVFVTNEAGTLPIGPATSAVVNTAQTLASVIPATALPATVLAVFGELNAVIIAAGATGGGLAAVDAAAGGFSASAATATAIAAAVAAVVSGDKPTTGTTGTTGTAGVAGN